MGTEKAKTEHEYQRHRLQYDLIVGKDVYKVKRQSQLGTLQCPVPSCKLWDSPRWDTFRAHALKKHFNRQEREVLEPVLSGNEGPEGGSTDGSNSTTKESKQKIHSCSGTQFNQA
jgi:hypothetical protein